MANVPVEEIDDRNKPQLHKHMKDVLGYVLPELRYCKLEFLQQILGDHKEVIKENSAIKLNINKVWQDWSVRHGWSLIKHRPEIHRYLPVDDMNEGRYPDRTFFW